MKKKPSLWGARLAFAKVATETLEVRRFALRLVDDCFVRFGVLPAKMDGRGKVLHLSDTPTKIYRYLALTLRRVNPAVVVHTGDIADDIKIGIYPVEAGRYAAAAKRLMNVLLAPHRTVVIALGNHDRADLLPPLPQQCIVRDGAFCLTFFGERFKISHYIEKVTDAPERYNLFGHDPCGGSFEDADGRSFFNGIETMRMIDPATGNVLTLPYPMGTDSARCMRGGRMAK